MGGGREQSVGGFKYHGLSQGGFRGVSGGGGSLQRVLKALVIWEEKLNSGRVPEGPWESWGGAWIKQASEYHYPARTHWKI